MFRLRLRDSIREGSRQIHQLPRKSQLVLEAMGRALRRKAYLEGSEVDDTVDVWVCREDLVQSFLVCDIDFVELWSLPAE